MRNDTTERSCNFYNLLLECGTSPVSSPHCRSSTGTKTTRPGTCTQQPHHALGPFGTDKHFSLSAITYFCLENKESPSKAAPKSVLIQPSLKASSCRHSQVLTPALIFYCCLIFGISSATSAGFFLSFLLFFSSECSKSGSSSHDF